MQSVGQSVEVVTEVLKAGISNLMNLASQGGDPSSGVFFVNFNQDCSSLAVGSKSGYKLFSLNAVEKLDPIYENDSEDICIVERLFSSSLVAIVSLSSPRKLKVCHFKKGTEICNYSYSNTILAVKLNRSRLIVCLEESLYIHNIRDMKVMHTIRDTPPNPNGLCALSTHNDNCYLAYPGSNTIGEVQIFDAENLQAKTMIPAHDNPLVALAFNSDGTKIATASEKGTVIRVFAIQDGTKLFEFRRGMKRCVSIYSLAFSADSVYLCASSNTETVHIFKLEGPKESKPVEENQGWMGYVGKALMSSASYLPTQVTDMFNQGRAFANVHLPFSGLKNVCTIATVQKIPRVLVASADGYLYIYNLDTVEGGDCTLVKQHRVDSRPESAVPTYDAAPTAVVVPSPKDVKSAVSVGSSSSSGSGTNTVPPPPPPVSTPTTYSAVVQKPDKAGLNGLISYAGILQGKPQGLELSESERRRQMDLAMECQPKEIFGVDYDMDFPPMTQKND